MLERIAKEMGNVHTNRREVSGHGGGPLRFDYSDLTDEQLDARIAQLLGGSIATFEKCHDMGGWTPSIRPSAGFLRGSPLRRSWSL